jgi:hypothetical protein
MYRITTPTGRFICRVRNKGLAIIFAHRWCACWEYESL